MIPPPPAGFDTEVTQSSGSNIPPPPAGFTQDVTPSAKNQDAGDYWGDVKKNAIEGIKQWPGAADQLYKAAETPNIFNVGKSVTQMSNGTPFSETPTGQSVEALKQVGSGAAKGLWQTAKDAGAAAVMPLQVATGTAPRSTIFGRQFRQRPLSTTANVVGAAGMAKNLLAGGAEGAAASTADSAAPEAATDIKPDLPVVQPGATTGEPHALFAYNENLGKGFEPQSKYQVFGDPNHPVFKNGQLVHSSQANLDQLKEANVPVTGRTPRSVGQWEPLDDLSSQSKPAAPPPEAAPPPPPSYLETKGAQGLNSLTGITDNTIRQLTKRGQNPATTGAAIAKQFSDEGAIGGTPGETFDKFNSNFKQAGKEVRNAWDAIKGANKSLGVYPELEDSLKVQANPILKPIIDKSNSMLAAGYDRQTGNLMKRMYTNLQTSANENNGFLTIDAVREEMDHVGDMFKGASRDSPKWAQASMLYGKLHDIQDAMVDDIAGRVSDPKLAQNLIKANSKYSRYARVMPDVSKYAARSVTGQMSLGGIAEELKNAIFSGPQVSRATMQAGSIFKRPK